MKEVVLLPAIGCVLSAIIFYLATTLGVFGSLLFGVVLAAGMILTEAHTSHF